MPIIGSKGAESSGGFGQFAKASGPATYIEDVFSTWLYTGTGATQSIVNGIDLSTKGGLVWLKPRSNVGNNTVVDTARGVGAYMYTNATTAQNVNTLYTVTAFNTNGFTLGLDNNGENAAGYTEVSWTFRKQPKFFDVVTGSGGATVSHKLGVVPSCIIIKIYSGPNASDNWRVFHKDMPAGGYNGGASGISSSKGLILNSTAAAAEQYGGLTGVTSTEFNFGQFVVTGDLWVAYVFASDAGGFGLTGTDNVITCGSYTGTGATGNVVTLGYEPQWILFKQSSTSGNHWIIVDVMRGLSQTGQNFLYPESNAAEVATSDWVVPTATGFNLIGTGGILNASGSTYIYIAIRRGPMKVPTTGTSVFSPNIATGGGSGSAGDTITTNFVTDLAINQSRNVTGGADWFDRLRGNTPYLLSYSTSAEFTPGTYYINFTNSNTSVVNVDYGRTSSSYVQWSFQRAPGFLDVVCWKGSGVSTPATVNHNLTVSPEMIIMFKRGTADVGVQGQVWTSSLTGNKTLYMPFPDGLPSWGNQAPTNVTSTSFVSGYFSSPEPTTNTFVAYLFATCPGVSKVGSYTGNGSTQTINCGFTGGARFVMIKRTDAAGDWYVYDTARGMTTLTDPYLLLNSTAAETATLGSVTTVTTGFALNSTVLSAINISAATYIFLAIA